MDRDTPLLNHVFRRESFWLWFGAIFLLVGVVAFVLAVVMGIQELRYSTVGEMAEGVVLGKSIQRVTRDGNSRTVYRVTYEFTTRSGHISEDSHDVSADTWNAVRERDPIRVEFIPDDPAIHRIVGSGGWAVTIVLVVLGSIFGGLGGVFFQRGLRRLLLERRLLRTGAIAMGTVMAVTQSNVKINRREQWVIHYRYQDDLGQTHNGQSGYMPAVMAHAWHAGNTGVVLFDHQRPEQSMWLGDSTVDESVARQGA